MSEENKALYERIVEEVWNTGDLDSVDEFFAPDVVIHSAPPEWPAGSDGVRATVGMWTAALPDFQLTSEFVMAEGDKVASLWTITGTHSGELMGVPATGNHIETYGVSVVRIEGGKVVEIWSASDQLSVMQQVGAIPS